MLPQLVLWFVRDSTLTESSILFYSPTRWPRGEPDDRTCGRDLAQPLSGEQLSPPHRSLGWIRTRPSLPIVWGTTQLASSVRLLASDLNAA